MPDWSEGYQTELEYTYGYFPETDPNRARLALLNAGWLVRPVRQACELGYGHGLGINIHAAASTVQWWGTDFHPGHAAYATGLSEAAGSTPRLLNEAFADFCARPDLPNFDHISLHGIWSWISPANRELLLHFIRRKLVPGGFVYLSCNALPGWAPRLPLRDLVRAHFLRQTQPGSTLPERIAASLRFMQELIGTQPDFARCWPGAVERFQRLMGSSPEYVAGELFGEHCEPFSFSGLQGSLAGAQLSFGAPASVAESFDALSLPAAQRSMLAAIRDTVLRETTRDLMVNRTFRRDLWIKGARPLTRAARLDAFQRERVVLACPMDRAKLERTVPAGRVRLDERIYGPLLQSLADGRGRSVAELSVLAGGQGITATQVVEAINVLCALRYIAFVQPDQDDAEIASRCRALNAHLLEANRLGTRTEYLASPVTGGGQHIPLLGQWFLRAWLGGATEANALAREADALRIARGEPAPDIPLEASAARFLVEDLPVLQALRIAVRA